MSIKDKLPPKISLKALVKKQKRKRSLKMRNMSVNTKRKSKMS